MNNLPAISIPDAIHICPGCGEMTSGPEYCVVCRDEAARCEALYHAARANRVYAQLPCMLVADEEYRSPLSRVLLTYFAVAAVVAVACALILY